MKVHAVFDGCADQVDAAAELAQAALEELGEAASEWIRGTVRAAAVRRAAAEYEAASRTYDRVNARYDRVHKALWDEYHARADRSS